MYDELRNDLSYFEHFSRFVSLQRHNPDGGINNYGYRLIDFCFDNSIYFMSGRMKCNNSEKILVKMLVLLIFFSCHILCSSM